MLKPMPTIEIAGRMISLNVVHHDSGESPQSENTNVLVCAKVGQITYQYLNIDVHEAIRRVIAKIEGDVAIYSMGNVPQMLTVVVSKFKQETTINWDRAETDFYQNRKIS